MKLKLSKLGYRLNSTTNVWSKPDFSGIAYSDGDEVEQHIAAIIEQANDLTVLSTELRQNCIDWPSLYHLSNSRANILRPFESSLHGNILEIGAGCGAITRYLGECNGNVLALEGSARRAAIARSRTRDLPNVTVVADNFEQFQCNERFDIVTLIGVLEYANLFISHGNPALSMLQCVRSLLKPEGKLIIAIENQLGLKYFAGAPEDHFGKSMYGIEGQYQNDQQQTYGRHVLLEMLKQAGFSYSEFMAPFPDYKLPVSIVTEKGFSHKGFDAAALAWQCVKRDHQLPSVLAFAPELVWPSLFKNDVALAFSNSFLVMAGDSVNDKADSSVLAWHFTTERSKEFCKVTRFLQRTNRLIETYCNPLSPDLPNHGRRRLLTFGVQEKAEYVQGRPLPQELIHIVTRDGWRIEDVGNFFKQYLEYLVSYASAQGVSLHVSSPESKIPGKYFDLIPQNIIIGHDGKWNVIDQEWVLNEDMPVGWLLFRSLLTLINSVTRFGLCADEFANTAFGFIKAVFNAMCFFVTEEQMENYGRLELAVQEEVSGKKLDQMLNSWRTASLQRLNLNQALIERDGQIAGLSQLATEREAQINNLNQVVTARDGQINGLNQSVAERDSHIASLHQSLAKRDGQIAGLNQVVAERDAQIVNLNQSVVDRDGQIVGFNQVVTERDAQIVNLNESLAERDVQIAGLSQSVAERDGQINDLNQAVAERDSQIALMVGQLNNERATITEMRHSTSWRTTIPLRFVGTIFKSVTFKIRSFVSNSLRVVYHEIPISDARKTDLKSFIYQRFALLIKNTKSYQHWVLAHSGASSTQVTRETTSPSSEPHGPCSSSSQVTREITIPSGDPHDPYDDWIEVNKWNAKRETFLRQRLQKVTDAPLLSVIMPVYDPPVEYLNRAIASVCSQVYANWELCIADDASTNGEVRSALLKWSETDERIKVCYRETNGNISIATNSAAALAGGSHLVFLDQDDLLTPDALGEIALYIAAKPETDILYSDDDKIDTQGKRFAPQFKPEWSPELLLSYMYFSHVFVVSRALFQEVGGVRIGFEGSQDYDLALRASEKARHVGHIPLVLYHWRVLPNSTASSAKAKPDSMEAGKKAVQDALSRRGIPAAAYQPDWAIKSGVGIFSHRFVHTNPPGVTIIIPTKDQVKVLKKCVNSILKMTEYPDYEILIIDNDSVEPVTAEYFQKVSTHRNVRIVRINNSDEGFDYAYINNRAVEFARSEYVLFLNNDIEVLRKDWLSQMVGYGQISGVGATGAKLLYPDRRIQHAGVLIKFYRGMAGHAFKGASERETGYLAYPKVLRNYSAVTAACLLTPRKLFIEMGGFDEKGFKVAYNDVDYCGRLMDRGYRVVYTPEAELIHHEGFSRGFCDNPRENVNFRNKYYGKKDRYYNPSLSLDNEYFEVWPRAVFTGDFRKTIKTLMCAHNLNHEGAPYSQYEMTVGLKEKGVLDPVVFSPVDGPLRALYESRGIRVIINPALGYIFEIVGYRERLKAFAVFIKELGVEMVYANTLINFHVIAAAREAGLPSIWNIRESEPWQHYQKMWGEELAAEAARCFTYPYKVIFVAHTTKQIYKEFEGRHNFHVIYNGLNLDRIFKEAEKYDRKAIREELGISDDELAVLLPGTICERKGQHDLAHALELLDPDCLKKIRCFIVGDWQSPLPYNKELRDIAASLPTEAKDRISILPISAEIFKYYKAADIFICSSRIESFPRIVLEAMAFNLPIITTPVFGIQEQVQEGVNAVFYNPGDYAALATALKRLIKDDGIRRRFSENAVFVLRQLENFDEMTESYATLFKEGYLSDGPKALMPEAIAVYKAMNSKTAGSIRKVTFLTSYQDENSQRFRVYNLIEGLTEAGVECAVFKEDFDGILDSVLDSDLLVVFRVGASVHVRHIIGEFKSNGIPTVFDVDDLVFEPESADLLHGLTALGRGDKQKAVEGFERLRQTLLLCDYATCTTKALAKRIEPLGKRCFVISNTINKKQFELAQKLMSVKKKAGDVKVRIGYFSGTRTHDKDFREVADALYKVMTENPQIEFHLVGILDLDSKFSKFGERIVRQPLMDYFKMLRYLAGMDINLAPLEMNNVFTACKSELKIFEAGLVEVPTVASATDSYAGCITDGANGFLAASKGEWVEKLESLIKDRKLRHRIGQRAEQDFVKKFYIENNIQDVIGSYKEICGDHAKSTKLAKENTNWDNKKQI